MQDSASLFLALRTQWRIGMAGATGLDYNAVPVTAGLLDIKVTPVVMLDLQLMEGEALAAWAKKG